MRVIRVIRITSVKSSIGIITHQGHISKVNANVQWVSQWLSSLLERLVTLNICMNTLQEDEWRKNCKNNILQNKERMARKESNVWKNIALKRWIKKERCPRRESNICSISWQGRLGRALSIGHMLPRPHSWKKLIFLGILFLFLWSILQNFVEPKFPILEKIQ